MLPRKTITALSLGGAILFLPFSVPLCHVSLGLFLLCWVSEGRWREKVSILKRSKFVWAYIFFFLLHIIGISYSQNSADGWFNLEKKVTMLLLPVAIATTFDLDNSIVRRLFMTFIATCLIGSLVCLAFAFGNFQLHEGQYNFDNTTLSLFERLNPAANPSWMFFSYVELASGIGMHPTFLAMYLVFCVILLYHLYASSFDQLSSFRKTILVSAVLYFSVFIVLLSSRIVILAYVLVCVAGIYHLTRRPTSFFPAATAFLCVIVLIALIDPIPRYRSLQEPFVAESYAPNDDGIYAYSTGIRKSLWTLGAVAMAEVNPVLGTGTGDVNDTLRKIGERNGIRNSLDSFDPHNEFVFILIALGGLGLLSMLACLVLPAWSAYQQKDFMYVAFIFVFAAVCMTESALESQKGIVFFTIFNSILVFQYFKLEPVVQKKLAYG